MYNGLIESVILSYLIISCELDVVVSVLRMRNSLREFHLGNVSCNVHGTPHDEAQMSGSAGVWV